MSNHHTAVQGPTATGTNQETWFWLNGKAVAAGLPEVGFQQPVITS